MEGSSCMLQKSELTTGFWLHRLFRYRTGGTLRKTGYRMVTIVINLPFISQVTLNSYSFENVAFHVLHERIPLYTFRTLSDWWDQRTSLNRWRTIDHYVRRCRGNVRILESVDFIGRTSELARLFGILFFSVICRGSQVFLMCTDLRFSWLYISLLSL